MNTRDQELSEDADNTELSSNGSHSHMPVNEGADSVVADADSVNPPTAMRNGAPSDDDEDVELHNDHVRQTDARSEGIDSFNDTSTGEEISNSAQEDADAGDNLEELCEGMASSDLSVRHTDEIIHESASAVNSWDERPLNVKHRQVTEEQQPAPVASDEEKSERLAATHSSEALSEDAMEMEVDQEHLLDQGDSLSNEKEEAPISSITSWDDRPIRPQQNAWSWDGALPADGQSGEDQAEQQLHHTSADSELPGENALSQSSELDDTSSLQPVDEETNDTIMTRDNSSWDDRPIRSQREPFKFEVDDVEEGGKIGADVPPKDGGAELDSDGAAHNDTDTMTAGSNSAWDDRPVRPQTEPFKFEAEIVNQVDTADVPLENGDRDNSSWDDRPIHPQRKPFKFELDDAEEGGSADAETDGPAELGIDEAARALTEDQPITGTIAYSWDERPIGSSDRLETKMGSMSKEIEDDNEKETEPIRDEMPRSNHFWDDRPICPQRKPFNFELGGSEDVGSADTQMLPEDGAAVLHSDGTAREPVEVQQSSARAYSWDERPIGSSAKTGLKIEHIEDETEMEREPVSVNFETDPDDTRVKGVKPFSSWNETPVGSTRPRSLPKSPEIVEIVEDQLDEQYQSAQSVSSWDETPVGQAQIPVMPASPEYKHVEVAPADLTSRPPEDQSLNSHSEVAHNANEKSELDGETAIDHRIEDDQVDQGMELEVTSTHGDLHGDSNSPFLDGTPRSNDGISSDKSMSEELVCAESMDIEHDEIFENRDAEMNGAMEDEVDGVRDYKAPSPVYIDKFSKGRYGKAL
uniref:Uncharacterized protein n=1 Tax=Globisporangium ultimum (strain ATCC 200006 / CBS 805.95 / DAOM BR144) TaxID=431595 RepID=K3WRG5_GLOUD